MQEEIIQLEKKPVALIPYLSLVLLLFGFYLISQLNVIIGYKLFLVTSLSLITIINYYFYYFQSINKLDLFINLKSVVLWQEKKIILANIISCKLLANFLVILNLKVDNNIYSINLWRFNYPPLKFKALCRYAKWTQNKI